MSGSQRVSLLVLSFQRNPESPEVLKTVYRNLHMNLEDAALIFCQRRHVSTPAPEWILTSELEERARYHASVTECEGSRHSSCQRHTWCVWTRDA